MLKYTSNGIVILIFFFFFFLFGMLDECFIIEFRLPRNIDYYYYYIQNNGVSNKFTAVNSARSLHSIIQLLRSTPKSTPSVAAKQEISQIPKKRLSTAL